MSDKAIYNLSINFHRLKIKYSLLSDYFDNLLTIMPNDKVLVFVNLDSAFNLIFTTKDSERIFTEDDPMRDMLVVDILNLAGHYKRFFRSSNLETHVVLYTTDTNSLMFNETLINDNYRGYYLAKFNKIPKYKSFSALIKTSLKDVKNLSEFVNGVYYVPALNIESSLIPAIVSKMDIYAGWKKVIFTSDLYDNQYRYMSDYTVFYMRRHNSLKKDLYRIEDVVEDMLKRNLRDSEKVVLYNNRSILPLLMSVNGDKNRSINGIRGVGYITLMNYINDAISDNRITTTTESIEIISELFNDYIRDNLISNFNQLFLPKSIMRLTDTQRLSIVDYATKDRFDNDSLIRLNSTRFYNYQLDLEALTR